MSIEMGMTNIYSKIANAFIFFSTFHLFQLKNIQHPYFPFIFDN